MKTQFVIDREPVVRWPVTVALPQAGGKIAEFRFEADIRVCSEEEFETIVPDHAEAPKAEEIEAKQEAAIKRRTLREVLQENAQVLPRLVRNWYGVCGPAGTPVPISDLPSTITGPYGRALSIALWRAIHQVRYGIPADETPGAAEGNSAPSPAAG